MKAAYEAKAHTMDPGSNYWKQVKGPATAVLAMLYRLKWTAREYDTWKTAQRQELHLEQVIPYHLKAIIKKSVDRLLWEESTLRKKDTLSFTSKAQDNGPTDRNDFPNWSLARRVVLGKDKAIGDMARSVNINTHNGPTHE